MSWYEVYSCGCSVTKKRKYELLGYCSIHGASWKERINTTRGSVRITVAQEPKPVIHYVETCECKVCTATRQRSRNELKNPS